MNEEILSKLEMLEEVQQKLDRKTKDAEAYRDINNQICGIMNKMIVSIVIVVIISAFVCGYCINRMHNLECCTDKQVVSSTEQIESGDGGVIINGNGNNSDIDSDSDISK